MHTKHVLYIFDLGISFYIAALQNYLGTEITRVRNVQLAANY